MNVNFLTRITSILKTKMLDVRNNNQLSVGIGVTVVNSKKIVLVETLLVNQKFILGLNFVVKF